MKLTKRLSISGLNSSTFLIVCAVLGVVLHLQHVHEGAVVDAVHPQRADEISLHQPERFGQQQCVRTSGGHPVDHLAPEFLGHELSNSSLVMPCSARDGMAPAVAGLREPQTLEMLLGQRHGGIETDDRELSGDMEDRLDHRLAHLRHQEIELRGVVPGHAGAVVAVIDVLRRHRSVDQFA